MPTAPAAAAAFHVSLCFSTQKSSSQAPVAEQVTTLSTSQPPKSLLHKHPLWSPTHKNISLQFKEKILCLEIMGVDSGRALAQNPCLHTASLHSIHSIINFLESKGIQQKDLGRIFGMCPRILTSDIKTNLYPVFKFLSYDLKVPEQDLRKIINKCPRLLDCSVRDQLKPTLFYLQRLGFKDLHALAYQDPILLVSSVEKTLIPKLDYLASLGFSRSDAVGMVKRCPDLFTFSIENNFKPKFEYFVEEMKGTLEDLKEFPQFFTFSLEKRIKPRHMEVLQTGVNVPLPLLLKSTDEEFSELLKAAQEGSIMLSLATKLLAKQMGNSKVDTPKEIFLKDYKPPEYYFDTVDLTFSLGEEKTIVCSKINVSPRVEGFPSPLVLDGEDLELIQIKVNGKELQKTEFQLDSRQLSLTSPPVGKFILEIVTEIYPHKNTACMGLYKSSGIFCTQCEAEGFRKITFYQDRPDVMAKYTCRIEADKSLYPVLLSNGNLIEQGDAKDGKHYVIWEDPFKKPCYLFALVAGKLESRDDTFTTRSGRKVSLRIITPPEDVSKTEHAMYSLKAAMKWDEDVFGLEYDLDLFNIVAVPDFNMGAMENKSLNIFNSRLVLASPETATDLDYAAILGVIGHEYFHNWTGNRVTCRDWFQLSLKEGLTVFRDQEFSSDMGSRAVKRIGDVSKLRIFQFPQDAGPMAHPVRPHSYIKMDNFYTVTVYEKGAEVVRMYKTLLGSQGFRKGMDLYFKRHDGQAVTCEDFFAAMRDANGADLLNFLLWYSQAGTPCVKVTSSYNAEARALSLKFSQEVPPTVGQPTKEPMFIPVAIGLLDSTGQDMPISSISHDGVVESIAKYSDQPVHTIVLRVTKKEQEFVFNDVSERPVPSILRSFSAPIRLNSDLLDSDLYFLLAHDSDEFNRWEAGQVLARKLMLSLVAELQQNKSLVLNPQFIEGIKSTLCNASLDKEFIAKAITLPGEGEVMDLMEVADPDAVHAVRSFIRKKLASELKDEFIRTVKSNRSSEPYVFDHPNMSRRALKNIALGYLGTLGDPEVTELALHEYRTATNMTEQVAALLAIEMTPGKTRDEVLADFYNKWKHDYLVITKWLAIQAFSDTPGNVKNVRNLLNHPAFDMRNPNKAYALIGGFCGSSVNFHAKDGSGYKFLGEMVVQLDRLNPQVSSRMVSALSRWQRYDKSRQALAKAELEKILSAEGLSENVFEIASKSLAA